MYECIDAEHNRAQLLCVLAWEAIINMVQKMTRKAYLFFAN